MKYLLIFLTLFLFASCDRGNPEATDTVKIPKKVYELATVKNAQSDSGQVFGLTDDDHDYYFVTSKPAPVLKYKYDMDDNTGFMFVLILGVLIGFMVGALVFID